MTIEKIEKNNKILAIIIRADIKDKLNFPTPKEFPMQLGIHNRDKGEESKPHIHFGHKQLTKVPSHELFHIIKGKVQINIYDFQKNLVKEVILNTGDTIFLTAGHSVKFLEKTKMLEVKQGPFRKKLDKEYF